MDVLIRMYPENKGDDKMINNLKGKKFAFIMGQSIEG
jgi:hypothetical protein